MSAEQYPVRPEFRINEDEITGYAEPWVVSPGETTDIKVSIGSIWPLQSSDMQIRT